MSQDLGLDLGIDFCRFPRQFSCAARVRKLALGVLVTSGQASLLPSLPPGGRSLEAQEAGAGCWVRVLEPRLGLRDRGKQPEACT